MNRMGRIPNYSNEADPRQRFLEELEPLTDDLKVDTPSHPGHIPARARETRNEAKLDRIRGAQHDDWNRPGGLLRRQGRGGRSGCDRIDIQPNKFSRKVSQTIGFSLRESMLNYDVLALDPSEFAEPLSKSLNRGRGGRSRR